MFLNILCGSRVFFFVVKNYFYTVAIKIESILFEKTE